MQKAQFTIGVDVSRNTLDIYCIEAGKHITILPLLVYYQK